MDDYDWLFAVRVVRCNGPLYQEHVMPIAKAVYDANPTWDWNDVLTQARAEWLRAFVESKEKNDGVK